MLWRTPACRSPSGCSPTQLLETEVASGRDTVLGEAPPGLSFNLVRFAGYDPQNEDRIVLLLPPRRLGPDYTTVSDRGRVVHIDRSRPGVIERMFTLDASDDRDLVPKAVSPGGGIVAVLAARFVTQGGDSIVTFQPPPLPNSTPVRSPARVEMLRLAADGQRMLVFVTTSYQDAETQDAALLEPRTPGPTGLPANAHWLTRQEGGFIRGGAISANGRQAALIIQPVTGSDPQPVLWTMDFDEAEPQLRARRTLADLGVGRTPYRARMTPDELLRGLRAIAEGGRPQADAIGEAAIRRVGARLSYAGPCVTVTDAIRILGQPEPDHPDMRMIQPYNPLSAEIFPPRSHPRNGVTVRYRSGLEVSLTFFQQYCASAAAVGATEPAR